MTLARYSRLAMALHWGIALALAFQLALGWRLEEMAQGVGQFAAYQLHKSVGIAILLASVARLVLRFFRPPPPPLPDSVLNLLLARLVHWGFYLVMIGGPLTGWALVSTAKIKVPTLVFGMLPWPHLPLAAQWNGLAAEGHELLAILGVALFVLHVAGALRHQLVKGERLLERMMPVAQAGMAAALLALLAVAASHAAAWFWPFEAGQSSASAPAPTPAASPAPAPAPEAATDAAAEDPANDTASSEAEDAPAPDAALPVSPWQIEPGGRLGFAASWNGAPVPGRFERWTGDIRFSPDDLAGSRIRVDVELGSVATDDAQYADSLKGPDFFNVAANPRASFTSRAISHRGGNRYRASGTLSLSGVTRPATLDFTLDIKDDMASVKGSTRLDRTSFGVGKGDWAKTDQIGAGVDVNFSFRAKRKAGR